MKRLVVSLGISGMGLFLSGCARPDTDVTSSASYNFSSFAGTAWKTKVKTALAEIGQGMPRYKLHLVAPNSFDPTHPEYNPIHKMGVIAELPPGTRVCIQRLMKSNDNWGGVWVTAALDDGKFVHLMPDFLAKNRFVWPGWSDSKEWGVDPKMLDKAD